MNLDRLSERVKALETLAGVVDAKASCCLTRDDAVKRVQLIMALVAHISGCENDLFSLAALSFDQLKIHEDQIEYARYCAHTLAELFLRSEWRRQTGKELTMVQRLPPIEEWPDPPAVRDLESMTDAERAFVFSLFGGRQEKAA